MCTYTSMFHYSIQKLRSILFSILLLLLNSPTSLSLCWTAKSSEHFRMILF
jgi:hypothetical protein